MGLQVRMPRVNSEGGLRGQAKRRRSIPSSPGQPPPFSAHPSSPPSLRNSVVFFKCLTFDQHEFHCTQQRTDGRDKRHGFRTGTEPLHHYRSCWRSCLSHQASVERQPMELLPLERDIVTGPGSRYTTEYCSRDQ